MSVKEHVYRMVSQELDVPHDTVKRVLDNQFRTALSALKDNNSLEIAGFGKILMNRHRLRSHIRRQKEVIKYYKKQIKDSLVKETVKVDFRERLKVEIIELKDLELRAIKYDQTHGNNEK